MTPGMVGGMSKGNPRVILRVEPRLLALVQAEISRVNERRRAEPYELSSWVRQAMIEKLRHGARSRGGDGVAELAELEAFAEVGR
jgi:hypothetical protein